MKHIKPYLKPYTKQFFLGPLFKLLEALLELTLPLFIADIVDNGIARGDKTYIFQRGSIMLLVALAGVISAIVCQYSASVASQGFGTAVRNRLFSHINALSTADIDRFGTDTLTTRVTNDVTQLQTAVAMIIRLLLRAPFISIGCIAAAMMVDLPLSAVVWIANPLFAAVLIVIMVRSAPLYTRLQQKLDRLSQVLRETLTGQRVIRALARSDDEKQRFDRAANEVRDSAVKVGAVSSVLSPLTSLIMNAAIMAILWFGGVRVQLGAMTTGQVIAFINYMTQVLAALIAVANLAIIFTRAHASLGRVNEVLETPAAPAAAHNPAGINLSAPAVEFSHVSFSYEQASSRAVEDVSFSVPRGGSLGIIGGTGAGKSTVVHLLCGLYTADSGHIRIGGADLHTLSPEQQVVAVGCVQQQVLLFSGTIADAIRWGNPDATGEEVEQAARTAQAAEFIERLPRQYDTPVGNAGRRFSGGQRQRLSIARAVIKRPNVLILDDAASALDFATEAALRRSLAADLAGTAVITVSQRVSSIRFCQQILVLEHGQPMGLGTHEELLAHCPQYIDIAASQEEVTVS